MKTPLGRAAVFCLPGLILLVAITLWNPRENFWGPVETPKAQCEAYDCVRLRTLDSLTPEIYDQRKLDRLIREPQNTVSNFGYCLAGLAVWLAARRPASKALGLAGIFLGLGSGMYHASLLPEWRLIDILGVYAVLYCLLLVGGTAVWSGSRLRAWEWSAALAVWVAAIYTGAQRNEVRWLGLKVFDSTYVFVAATAAGCLLALLAHWRSGNRRHSGAALILMGAAAGISFAGGIGDRFGGFWAAPESFPQGHAVWHAFGAVAMVAAYEIFSSSGVDRSTVLVSAQR